MKKLLLPALLTGMVLLFSCNAHKVENEKSSELADTVAGNGATAESAKLVKSATIDFKVKDVYRSAGALKNAARANGGLISNQTINSYDNDSKTLQLSNDSMQVITSYTTKAYMLVRIPAENLDSFLEQVSANAAYIKNLDVLVEDKSLQYLASRLKQQNRDRLYENELAKKHKTSEAINLISQKDKAVDNLVANRQINTDVKYSTIQLTFYQDAAIRKETVANNDLSYYRLPFGKNMGDAFTAGWDYFLGFIVAITHLWVFVLAGILGWGVYRYYRVRKVGTV